MRSFVEIDQRLEQLIAETPAGGDAAELLGLGEEILEHWVVGKGKQPTREMREGFRLLGLHRQGADKDPSFNACRETCRELVYHYNLLTSQPGHPETEQRAAMMAWVARHLLLFVSGKMEVQQLGDFCCASRPLRERVDGEIAAQ